MKLKYKFENVDMGEEIIAVPVGSGAETVGGVVKMNESALEIFNMLTNEVAVEEIVSSLSQKYNDDVEKISKYVHQTLTTLKEAGLIEE